MRIGSVIFICALTTVCAVSARDLELPKMPDDLRSPAERARYLLEHYWDAMDWRDTALTRDDMFMEQAAADFYSVFHAVDSLTASKAVGIMLDGASADPAAYTRIADISRSYLFDPESPIADDESFIVAADRLLADQKLNDADLLRLAESKRMAMMNRVGQKAADFEYIDRAGNVSALYDALGAHPQNILMFYDPDCHICAELEERLMAMELGDIGVIMICPFGEQDGLWAQHAATLPGDWTVGRPVSEGFEDEELYELRSIPTVLMIDNNGIVLSKGKLDL